jgi:single-strand selective monofunctional uracil DNA glycosylase
MPGRGRDKTRESRLDRWGRAWRRSARMWAEMAPKIEGATGWRTWNPGAYGERWHRLFRRCYPPRRDPLVIFGLNPGPYGMAQTGIPFTDIKRVVSCLPGFLRLLQEAWGKVEIPGLAPADLRPYLGRTFESSSVRVYRFLERGWGSAEAGWREVVVANPCTLLFMDPGDRRNRTPADLGRTARARGGGGLARNLEEECDRLRIRCALDALEALHPRGAILLGKDVQAALGAALIGALGDRAVVKWEHPARAVPDAWTAGLLAALQRLGLKAGPSGPSKRRGGLRKKHRPPGIRSLGD